MAELVVAGRMACGASARAFCTAKRTGISKVTGVSRSGGQAVASLCICSLLAGRARIRAGSGIRAVILRNGRAVGALVVRHSKARAAEERLVVGIITDD